MKNSGCRSHKDFDKTFFKSFLYPNKSNSKNPIVYTEQDLKLLRQRRVVESSFAWISNYRRISVRYECQMHHYISMVYLAYLNIVCKKVYQ